MSIVEGKFVQNRLITHYGADMLPTEEMPDDYKDAFIALLLIMVGNITGRQPMISMKKEALESFADVQHPLYIWNNTKEDWSVMLPKPKPKIVEPNRNLFLPG